MRILHVAPSYYPSSGGAETHVQAIAERLARRGHRVTVLTTNANSIHALLSRTRPTLPAIEIVNEVRVIRVDPAEDVLIRILDAWEHVKGGYRSLGYFLTRGGRDMLLCGLPRNLRFFRSILSTPADIVVTWNWHFCPAYQVYLARRFKKFRLIGVPLFHTEEEWAQRSLYGVMIRACDGLIVNTEHEGDFIRRRILCAPPIRVGGVGVNPESFIGKDGAAFRAQYGLADHPVVGFVGRVTVGKGVAVLLEAMRLVWRRNDKVRLILAGTRSYDTDKMLSLLTDRERTRILFFPDFDENLKKHLYDAIDVFAMPSVAESFGIAYLEAWLCKKPVIGSRIGSTLCVIRTGVDGCTVNPNDPVELGQTLRALLEDPQRRAEMGERGYAKTIARFTWDQVATLSERFYAEILNESSGRSVRAASSAPGEDAIADPKARASGGLNALDSEMSPWSATREHRR